MLVQLGEAERAVNRAALETVGESESTKEMISKMEEVVKKLREEQLERIYS